MTKSELIEAVALKCQTPRRNIEHVITAAIDIITDELAQGGKVLFIGFGTFEVHDRAEHNARNPRTGEPIKIPAHKIPHFKPGKSLKAAVSGDNAHDR